MLLTWVVLPSHAVYLVATMSTSSHIKSVESLWVEISDSDDNFKIRTCDIGEGRSYGCYEVWGLIYDLFGWAVVDFVVPKHIFNIAHSCVGEVAVVGGRQRNRDQNICLMSVGSLYFDGKSFFGRWKIWFRFLSKCLKKKQVREPKLVVCSSVGYEVFFYDVVRMGYILFQKSLLWWRWEDN